MTDSGIPLIMSENYLESALEQNRNTNQAVYALAASSQRQAQLRALEAQREAQAQMVATEQARLEIERQRLALETARIEAAKVDAEAVKVLRRLLADVGAEIETIRREANLA